MAELAAPVGAPTHASFGGIVEGPLGDRDALERIEARLRAMGLAPALEIEGGRFSLMLVEGRVPGSKLDEDGQQALLDALQACVSASGDAMRVESTLRCQLEFDDALVETIFRVRGGELDPMSRVRARDAEAPSEAPAPPNRRAVLRTALVVLALGSAGAASIWHSGLVGRVLAPDPSEIELDTAGFGAALDVELVRVFPDYRVVVRRGDAYPADDAARASLEAEAVTAVERLTVEALAGSDPVWALLVDELGGVLEAVPLDLRSLVLRDDGAASALLRSGRDAKRLLLSLDAGGTG